MNAPVAGVLFDIGGVLVALDGIPALTRLLGLAESREDIHRRWLACPSVVLHETGRMTADEFAQSVVADLAIALGPEAFLAEFDGWLTGPHPGAFELVKEIPTRYRVAALSNMSTTHWHRIKTMGWPARFEAAYVSCETGHLAVPGSVRGRAPRAGSAGGQCAVSGRQRLQRRRRARPGDQRPPRRESRRGQIRPRGSWGGATEPVINPSYSAFKTATGSIRVVRRAGIQLAVTPIVSKVTAAAPNVAISRASIP